MPNADPLRRSIQSFIEEIAYLDEGELQGESPLFSSGIIDSVSLLQLVCFVEEQAGMKVPPGELTLANWDSLDRIIDFIQRKRG